MKKVISIYNQKGGVSKTTFTILLSKFISDSGKKALAIDLDSQESLTHYFSQSKEINEEKTIFNILAGMIPAKEAIVNFSKGLDFIPGDLRIFKLQASLPLNTVQKLTKNLDYDYIILDNSPSYHSLIVSGIIASDIVLIPSLNSNFDFKSTCFTIEEIEEQNPKAKILTVINRQSKMTKELETSLEKYPLIKSHDIVTFPNIANLRKLKFTDKVRNATESLFNSLIGVK